MYVCMYVRMYVLVYICIYIYVVYIRLCVGIYTFTVQAANLTKMELKLCNPNNR